MDKLATAGMNVGSWKVIYIYSIPSLSTHTGRIKVGETTLSTSKTLQELLTSCVENDGLYTSSEVEAAAHNRIKDQLGTAQVNYKLESAYLALRKKKDDAAIWESFRDYSVHKVLQRSNIAKVKTNTGKRTGEWFSTTVSQAESAIRAVVHHESSIAGESVLEKITLRPEQVEAVKKTLRVFQNGTPAAPKNFLWNAIMRFGKTLTTYELVKQMPDVERVLVLTHRPVVGEGWKKDFDKVFNKESGWVYSSKRSGEAFDDAIKGKFFYFASVQDLRGSFTSCAADEDDKQTQDWSSEELKEVFTKNREIFETDFDLIVLDEAHEGLKTELADRMFSSLKGKYYLKLSGTPFNLMEEFDSSTTYTWSYIDERKAKEVWALENPNDSNPYSSLPEMEIRTIDLNEVFKTHRGVVDPNRIFFDFNKFFEVDKSQILEGKVYKTKLLEDGTLAGGYHPFKNQNIVTLLLDRMTETKKSLDPSTGTVIYEDTGFPYSSPKAWIDFADTFWILPNIPATRALHELLLAHNSFDGVAIVNASGNNDSGDPLNDVQEAIKNNKKTITLSIGKLTTGTTVPEWTAVFMLSNMRSAMNYMQTIFRSKSSGSLRDGRAKEKAYVFDFDPDRSISTIMETGEHNARASISRANVTFDEFEAARELQVQYLLNYLPIIAYNGVRFQKADFMSISKQIQRINIDKAVQSGFHDFRLFNREAFLDVSAEQLGLFKDMALVVGKNTSDPEARNIKISESILSKEARATLIDVPNLPSKPKPELNETELECLEEYKAFSKNRQAMMVTLRGIAVRIPLLILGVPVTKTIFDDVSSEITVENFPEFIDDESWEQFMPKGFAKYGRDRPSWEIFSGFFNREVFGGAIHALQRRVMNIHNLPPMERIPEIAYLFSTFRHPDKETILTPWRVVNLQYAETLGGLRWVDMNDEWYCSDGVMRSIQDALEFKADGLGDFAPVWIEGHDDFWDDPKVSIFDINSKTALYPLYGAVSIFWRRRKSISFNLNEKIEEAIWQQVLEDHVFSNCRVKYSASIAGRVLAGYNENVRVNTSIVDVISVKKHLDEFSRRKSDLTESEIAGIWRYIFNPESFGKATERAEDVMNSDLEALRELAGSEENLKFSAVCSNPPYQAIIKERIGQDGVATNIFHHFYSISSAISHYTSMIFPGGRWMQRSKGCEGIADELFKTISKVFWYPNGTEKNTAPIFPGTYIADGLSIVFSDFFNIVNTIEVNGFTAVRPASGEIIPLQKELFLIAKKGIELYPVACNAKKLSSGFFGLRSFWVELNPSKVFSIEETPDFDKPIKAFLGDETPGSAKKTKEYWIDHSSIVWTPEREKVFKSWKVVGTQGKVSKAPETVNYFVVDNEHIVGETWLILGLFETEKEAQNYCSYISSGCGRTLLSVSKGAKIAGWGSFLPDLEDYTDNNPHIDWSLPLDPQLYKLFKLTDEEIGIVEGK